MSCLIKISLTGPLEDAVVKDQVIDGTDEAVTLILSSGRGSLSSRGKTRESTFSSAVLEMARKENIRGYILYNKCRLSNGLVS